MNALQHFAETPWAAALGWAVLHSLWQGALISALLALTLFVFRSPRLRYAAAGAAMLAMLAAFVFTIAELMPAPMRNAHRFPVSSFASWKIPLIDAAASSWPPNLADVAPWLAPLWLTGVWLFCLRRLASWIWLQRLRTHGVFQAPEHWQQQLSRLVTKLQLSRPVRLLESCLTEVPGVLGHFRPLILMPVGLLSGLPAAQIETILIHELIHIRRHDYIVNVMQRLAESLLFYHPATWWISKVMRIEREHCCDDTVVTITGNALDYAELLATLEQNRFSGREPAIAVTGGHLMNRIQRLLHPTQSNCTWAPLLAAAIFLATAGIDAAALHSNPETSAAAAQAQTDAANPPLSRYERWLNQDVLYIIDDTERTAFVSLPTDAERDHFIEQFWERRNPTPGSSQNAFKEEHYRRIAYSDQHFRTHSGTAGWRTDRGHMYIVFGPPDELEFHPKSPQNSFATENWLYHHLEAIGDNENITFVDRSNNGDFRVVNFLDHKSSGEIRFAPTTPPQTSNDPSKPVRAGINGVGVPTCLYCPAPSHNKNGHTGVVVLKIVVGLDGQAENISKVSGADELVAIAIETVKAWRFQPAKDSGGQPVSTEVPIEVTFRSFN